MKSTPVMKVINEQAMLKFIEKQTHVRTAHFFMAETTPGTLKTIPGEKRSKIYKWDDETCLYKRISLGKLACIVQETILNSKLISDYKTKLHAEIDKLIQDKGKKASVKEVKDIKKDIEIATESIEHVENILFCEQVTKVVINLYEDEEFASLLDVDPDVVNFKNGLVDLRTGKFKYRRFGKHYFSKALDYDYFQIDDEIRKKMEFVKEMYLNINNDDIETCECVKDFFGYSLTGHVNREVCLAFTGASGSNGKTKLVETFMKSMDIYVKKLDNETFDAGYSKFHKQLAESKGKRLWYIEELKKKKMVMARFKDIIGGNHISNEIMYGTVEDIKITAKLVLISNNTLKFETDGGVERRGRLVECINKFIDEDEYKALGKKTKGFHIKDEDLLLKFNDDDYKLALFHTLLPYAMKHYEKGNKLFVFNETYEEDEPGYGLFDEEDVEKPKVFVSTKLHKAWKEICGINDNMAEFLDLYYTKSENDITGKDTFLSDYRKFTGLSNLSFVKVLSDIKKHGYTYDSQRRCNGERGVIIGLKKNSTHIRNGKTGYTSTSIGFDDSEDEILDHIDIASKKSG